MAKRNKKATPPASAPEMTKVAGEAAGVAPGGDAAVDVIDEEAVLAELAGDTAEDEEVIVVSTDVAEITAEDEEAVLAQVEAEADSAPATPATPTPAEPAIKRAFTDVAAIDQATLKAALDGCNAKKVVEKASNLIGAIERGKRLSRYTSLAIKALASDGRASGKSLTDLFQGAGLSVGTARAQAQQMTALFRIVGIAQPDATNARELVLADQTLANELVQLAA